MTAGQNLWLLFLWNVANRKRGLVRCEHVGYAYKCWDCRETPGWRAARTGEEGDGG